MNASESANEDIRDANSENSAIPFREGIALLWFVLASASANPRHRPAVRVVRDGDYACHSNGHQVGARLTRRRS